MTSIYLDTSVISAYFDARTPQRQELTRRFWHSILGMELVISRIVLLELEKTPNAQRKDEMLSLVEGLLLVQNDARVEQLATAISAENIVPPTKFEDAQHLASAIVHGIDYLVSWNFKHMVNFKTMDRLPIVAARHSYFKQLRIVSPQAFSGG